MFENRGALGSISLNGMPSEERRLKDGDLLQVGEAIFHFLEGVDVFSNLYAELSRVAHRDFLTGAFNQGYFWYILQEWTNLSTRMKSPLSLVMIDVDDFKRINTDHGHNGGDFILKHVVKRISHRLRKGDIFCRSGGDELSIILPNTTKENALKVAEEIRQEIAREPFIYEGVQIPITLSVGVSEYQSGMTKEQFHGAADQMMYKVKKLGKNRVEG